MNSHRFKAKDDFYEQNFGNNRLILKELMERKIGEIKSKIDSSLHIRQITPVHVGFCRNPFRIMKKPFSINCT